MGLEMTLYSWGWTVWIAFFCVLEFIAIMWGPPGATLSEHVWKVIGTDADSRSIATWVARGFVLALLAWLIPHMLTGWSWFK